MTVHPDRLGKGPEVFIIRATWPTVLLVRKKEH